MLLISVASRRMLVLCVLLLTVNFSCGDESSEYYDEYYDEGEDGSTEELKFDLKSDGLNFDYNYSNASNDTDSEYYEYEPYEEALNQDIADTFASWLDAKSTELHTLNMNNTGFKLLNETYHTHLRKDAVFKWINFTEMIMNISETISEVLYNKTLLVKDLSDKVEQAYDGYQTETEEIQKSLDFVYYDAKSPKTFCDVKEALKDELINEKHDEQSRVVKKRSIPDEPSHISPHRHHNKENPGLLDEVTYEYYEQALERMSRMSDDDTTRPPKRRRKKKKRTTTPIPTTTAPDDDEYEDYYEYDIPEEELFKDLLNEGYWDVTCLNRSFDENFKSINTKMNPNHSTIHIPVNVFKQSMEINMTAYWSENLNEQFMENYKHDPENSWQYFCSSTGLFRQYPAAYWTAPQLEDFFDCRLQSWYIMAAASSKDVLILLDTSGSMTGLRLEIATKLVESIMDTFTDNDFFNIITFATKSEYLFEKSEPKYANKFIQASKLNKLKFKEAIQNLNTSSQGKLTDPLIKAFTLFNRTELERSNCNKIIMVVTDGHSDDVMPVFDQYNHDKRVRVFSYKIGRDMTDPKVIKDLGCENNGDFYHVVTLTDINEHVYEYLPILSRPMALKQKHETTWSNVFLGYLDKELKIAVGRPAFVNNRKFLETLHKQKLYNKLEYLRSLYPLNSTHFENYTNATIQNFISNGLLAEIQAYHEEEDLEYEFDSRETPESKNAKILKQAKQINKEQVLLGVVGLDVSVLKLISKVSPKFQMGVGIYMIMIDNNGFIVFHPSIKQQIALNSDSKGTSQSIDLEKFEIPINNFGSFEDLEHEMIDEITGVKTLENWKRQGSRVVQRKTEYVYTSVLNTPFAVAIASPSSFGRYYIDLPSSANTVYEEKIKNIRLDQEKRFNTMIQLYNCSYEFKSLSKKVLNPEKYSDFCIKYLNTDKDQVLALKSDLIIHDIFYNLFNYTVFTEYPNLVKSSFYGTYSGATFYLPVTFFRPVVKRFDRYSKEEDETTNSPEPVDANDYLDKTKFETYTKSENLFGMADNIKHTYSFEKNYYTRAIEFSDYLRTSMNYKEPISIYILNETTSAYKDADNETISATMPVWLDNVPATVAGVVYNAKSFKERIFGTPDDCADDSCVNICSRRADLNVSCYLVDEHGIIVLDNADHRQKDKDVIGQLLYKVNPWLMLQLEMDGLYDLIVTGNKLQECTKPPEAFSSASRFFNMVDIVLKTIGFAIFQLFQTVFNGCSQLVMTTLDTVVHADTAANGPAQPIPKKINQNEVKIRNSHCFYFGIYSFNLTRWQTMDSNELKVWCNKTDGSESKKYLAGYLKHSNLVMLVVEDETQFSQCGNIEEMAKNRPASMESRLHKQKPESEQTKTPKTTKQIVELNTNDSNSSDNGRPDHSINRYRNDPLSYGNRQNYCHNYFANESMIFKCGNSANGLIGSLHFSLALAFSVIVLIKLL